MKGIDFEEKEWPPATKDEDAEGGDCSAERSAANPADTKENAEARAAGDEESKDESGS